jgi:hypothetical protein
MSANPNPPIGNVASKRNSLLSQNIGLRPQPEEKLRFSAEDIDSVFNALAQTSFNNSINSNSLSQGYLHKDPSDPSVSSTPKFDLSTLQTGIENSVKELLPDESITNQSRLCKQGLDKKSFLTMVRNFEEVMNSSTNKKEKEDILNALEKQSYELCDGNAEFLSQMLHLSTILESKDVQPLLDNLK